MIPFDFDYYRPDTIGEADEIYKELDFQRKKPLYYSGGSEIISMARAGSINTKAVIDLKAIPECNMLEFQGNMLVIGSSVTLSKISESKLFPLLGLACGRIADHTMQCKITLGGNIAGTIIYKEAILPLLLSDCNVIITSNGQLKKLPIQDVFNKSLQLSKGDFIVQFIINKEYTSLPYAHIKKTKNEKIDYPLISLSALKKENRIRLAMSGVCSFPFRSYLIEDDLNNLSKSCPDRASDVLSHLPSYVLNDVTGSDGYRKFVLRDTLINIMKTLEVNQ